jgi:Winged helix-turn helix
LSLGEWPKDLAALYGMTFQSICNWIHRLNEGGDKALPGKPKPGHPGRLVLPSYFPDLNPMERIWWYMRKKITHSGHIETMVARIEAFRKLMENFAQEKRLGKDLSRLTMQL